MDNDNFQFVVSNGPTVPKDPKVRTMIRRQAMKEIGFARRKQGNYARVNLRQFPVGSQTDVPNGASASSSDHESPTERDESSTSSTSSGTDLTSYDELLPWSSPSFVIDEQSLAEEMLDWDLQLSCNPVSPYELMRSKYQIDFLDLSYLTNFNISKMTSRHLEEPGLLGSLLGTKVQSFLDHIPSRYGSNPCLTAAVDCVWAKVHSRLAGPNMTFESRATRLYGEALRELQLNVSDSVKCLEADTLCAIQLLSIYEVLNPVMDGAWSSHVDGAARLITHRTSKAFKSNYEKALFVSHLGPVMSRSLESWSHCYLEEPEWRDVHLSIAEDLTWLSEASEVVIKIRRALLFLPGMLIDIDAFMHSDHAFDTNASASLLGHCRKMHQDTLDALEQYKAHLVRTSLLHPPEGELALRREMFGSALEVLCLQKRFVSALCDADRIRLEMEAQALATLISELHLQPSPKHSWVFQGHEMSIVASIQTTKKEWEEDVSHLTYEERCVAARTRWEMLMHIIHKSEDEGL